MATNPEDSPAQRTASIALILDAAIAALGAERAFLVSYAAGNEALAPRVEAAVSRRADGLDLPSRSVLRWARADPKPRIVRCTPDDPGELAEQVSVRALDLRHALAVAVPAAPPARRALVLDGRDRRDVATAELERVVAAFASLLALVQAPQPAQVPQRAARDAREDGLIGRSATFLRLLDTTRRVAPWRLPVLIHGESGVGKEGIARLLHTHSTRADGPFVAVNCGALPESLLESELFGASRGAYTGADQERAGLLRLAHGGTLFLDEVGDMPLAMQAKLLRVLQEGRVRPVGGRSEVPVDVRVVTATHRNLHAREREGLFRGDLLFRLAVIELRVPALRERIDDLPLLVEHLLVRLEEKTGLAPLRIAESALHKLAAWRWPGNVRELEAVLARALVRALDGPIEAAHIELPTEAADLESKALADGGLERRMLEAALRESRGNLAQAAGRIGWSRPKLYRRLSALGVALPRPTRAGPSACDLAVD